MQKAYKDLIFSKWKMISVGGVCWNEGDQNVESGVTGLAMDFLH